MDPSSGLDGSESVNHPWKYAGTLPTGICGDWNIRLSINIQICDSWANSSGAQVEALTSNYKTREEWDIVHWWGSRV